MRPVRLISARKVALPAVPRHGFVAAGPLPLWSFWRVMLTYETFRRSRMKLFALTVVTLVGMAAPVLACCPGCP